MTAERLTQDELAEIKQLWVPGPYYGKKLITEVEHLQAELNDERARLEERQGVVIKKLAECASLQADVAALKEASEREWQDRAANSVSRELYGVALDKAELLWAEVQRLRTLATVERDERLHLQAELDKCIEVGDLKLRNLVAAGVKRKEQIVALQAEVAAKDAKLAVIGKQLFVMSRVFRDHGSYRAIAFADEIDAIIKSLSDAEQPPEVERPKAEDFWTCPCGYMSYGGICTKCGKLKQSESERLRGVLREIRVEADEWESLPGVRAILARENM